MKKRTLIVLEGIDGVGKATQARLLAARLRAEGQKAAVFSFPDYSTDIGKIIRGVLHGRYGDPVKISPYLTAVVYALDRALAADKIRAALKRGIVISDRYTTSMAYGGATLKNAERKALFDFIESLEYEDLSIPRPSMVVYLDTPVSEAQTHIARKHKDVQEKNTRYQKKVAAVYRALAKQKKWKVVDGTGSQNEVRERIWDAVGVHPSHGSVS